MEISDNYLFNIADFYIRIICPKGKYQYINLLHSFSSFIHKGKTEPPLLFTLIIDDKMNTYDFSAPIKTVNSGNGDIIISKITSKGYQFIIKDINNNVCCILQTSSNFCYCKCKLFGNETMHRFGLNDAIMLVFAFSSSFHKTLLLHASCIKYDQKAYSFIAKSGTGKSTQVSMWLNFISDTELLNDDNPIIRITKDNRIWLYGSPWSGKTTCYRNKKTELGAIINIERGVTNRIHKLSPLHAMAKILPACSSMKWDIDIYNNICSTISNIIEIKPIYTLQCLPNKDSAVLCHKTLLCQ